mmetsp:Transcript_64494/g.189116  ORF Transcript_64494/g.189116 Transcript_64494/m.189116 type:complete len:519 (-) Transcript_64494:23-1579(-)
MMWDVPILKTEQEAWDHLGAEERWEELKELCRVYPPLFTMPRATVADWNRLDHVPDMHFAKKQKKAFNPLEAVSHYTPKWNDEEEVQATDEEDNRDAKICRQSMDQRIAFFQNKPWCRKNGCQLVVVVVVGSGLYHWYMEHQDAEMTQLLFRIFIMEWAVMFMVLCCLWVKAVVQISHTVFVWLSGTYEWVDRSGEVIALQIRRHIFTLVFGLMHCTSEGGQITWVKKRNSGHAFHKLEGKKARFRQAQVNVDNTISTECLFLDDDGEIMKVVWLQDYADKKPFCVPFLRHQGNGQLLKFDMSPWNTRDMEYVFDMCGPKVQAWVNSSELLTRLEFQLESEQCKLKGFREYLGPRVFNQQRRFILFASLVPLACILMVMLAQVGLVWSHAEISCNTTRLVPHLGFATGFGIIAINIAFLGTTEVGAQWAVNFVMDLLEAQVRRDWYTIMGVDTADDDFSLWTKGKASGKEYTIQQLWEWSVDKKNLLPLAKTVMADIGSEKKRLERLYNRATPEDSPR